MGTADREAREIHGKIVYYGAAGAGKTSNLAFIQRKLKREHRGELKRLSTRDGVTVYETLPVQLGAVRGFKTSIQISSVPGAAEAAALRRKLLEAVDGIVFVADLRPDRHQATVASLAELRKHLESYGRKLEDVPLVIQYNFRDKADENAVERLHRLLPMPQASVFEARADEGSGVLQTLTTLSKLLLVELRKTVDEVTPQPRAAAPAPARAPAIRAVQGVEPLGPPTGDVTAGFDDEPQALPEKSFQIESAGPVDGGGREIRIPVRLIDEATGRRVEIVVRVAIDAL
ncbi:MAG: GTPase domain-containing protein [Myxococcota bacterium]